MEFNLQPFKIYITFMPLVFLILFFFSLCKRLRSKHWGLSLKNHELMNRARGVMVRHTNKCTHIHLFISQMLMFWPISQTEDNDSTITSVHYAWPYGMSSLSFGFFVKTTSKARHSLLSRLFNHIYLFKWRINKDFVTSFIFLQSQMLVINILVIYTLTD